MSQPMFRTRSLIRQASSLPEAFSLQAAEQVRNFHRTIPGYKATPLVSLPQLAHYLGVSAVQVKDESFRFGLNAFKVLGGSYAMAHCMAKLLEQDLDSLVFEDLLSPAIKNRLGEITFITATDGNHGRGVAWTARQLKQKAVVYMPQGSSSQRLKSIAGEGASASITDLNYDDAVRKAAQDAEAHGWLLIQDTAYPDMKKFPGGLCRATRLWRWKPWNRWTPRQLICSFRLASALWPRP